MTLIQDITQAQKETLRTALLDALKNAKSQNDLARRIGISASTLINIKEGKWDKISEEMFYRLETYFRNDTKWGFYNTHNHEAITNMCMDAQSNHRFTAIA